MPGCYQSQNYKIWKQFTTAYPISSSYWGLLSITKLQNLKAIHNNLLIYIFTLIVVINHKTTKFESNSQLILSAFLVISGCYQSQNYKIWKQFITIHLVKHNKHVVVINHKITKFESNSQQAYTKANQQGCCYQSLNYKIWKQFTTSLCLWRALLLLLSITKLQNLKAIHNTLA